MKQRAFPYLIGLMVLPLAVGLACGSSTPTAEPTQAPAATQAPVTNSGSSSQVTTFTDQTNYLAIDVPGNWEYSQDKDTTNNYWYWDVFKSPDGHAGIESIVYDDGQPFVGTQSGKTALQWLHKYYSATGKEGDIRISDDSIQKDGSERLTWGSKGGNRSGISFFEIRKPSAMLMFTVWWDNDFEGQYADRLNTVIDSYGVP
jgi:hypothetical protein